jgi:hypothetical protein
MALGLSKGSDKNSNKGTSSGTSTSTLDPRLAQTLYGNIDRTKAMQPYQPYTGPLVAEFNQDQLGAQEQARTAAGANIGGGLLDRAATTAQGVANYTPTSVGGTQIDRSGIGNVGTAQTTGDDIARFMNPYEDTVVANSLSDLDRQRQRAQADNSAAATKLGAFRGTGLFNVRDRTDETFARESGNTAGQLRYQGFNTALGGAQADAARIAQAEAANQGVDASVASQNANLAQNAQLANQGAEQAGAGLQLQGAAALSGLSDQQREQAFGDIGLLGGVGDARQAREQALIAAQTAERDKGQQSKMDMQSLINQAIALIPQTGTTSASGVTTQNGKSKSKGGGLSLS